MVASVFLPLFSDWQCEVVAHADAPLFFADKAQCERVVDWKSRVFARSWARYDLAGHGTFQLVPPEARQPALARDYAIMRPMFMTEPPGFDMLLRELGRAENLINSQLPTISTHSPSSPT
jgi:hypothetical protein